MWSGRDHARTCRVRYVFLDVVRFSIDRSVEAQTAIVRTISAIVRRCALRRTRNRRDVVFLPTGDGICVAFMAPRAAYDIHLRAALDILSEVADHNDASKDPMRRFAVRIGLSENDDNLVTDINGHRNVAGAGINTAQRVMNFADGGQILVSETVYEALRQREQYMSQFRTYTGSAKHGLGMRVHQYLADAPGVDRGIPSEFAPPVKTDPALNRYQAHLIGLALRHRQLFQNHLPSGQMQYASNVLLHSLAKDAVAHERAVPGDAPSMHTYKAGSATLDAQLDYYLEQNFWLCYEASSAILGNFAGLFSCFDGASGFLCYVGKAGSEKLQREHPDLFAFYVGEHATLPPSEDSDTPSGDTHTGSSPGAQLLG